MCVMTIFGDDIIKLHNSAYKYENATKVQFSHITFIIYFDARDFILHCISRLAFCMIIFNDI